MKNKIIIIIIAVIFIIGAVGSVIVFTAPSRNTVNIVSNGEVLYTIDLNTAGDEMIKIPCGDHFNTVQIQGGKIRVVYADCPDQTCVRMGWLSSPSMPIVCLPHHLIVEYADGSGGVDAVTG